MLFFAFLSLEMWKIHKFFDKLGMQVAGLLSVGLDNSHDNGPATYLHLFSFVNYILR